MSMLASGPARPRTRTHSGRPAARPDHPDDGAPGPRPIYGPDYYGGFLRDPDANSAEAAHHDDVRPGALVDHLWIRVRDLEASAAFYETLAGCTGLRTGTEQDTRRQFRGAWGELSVLADGQPVTENLHLAFPAPNRRTVDAFHATALAAGYRSNGEPGERPQYGSGYYAAYVIDPDGHNIESVYRERPRIGAATQGGRAGARHRRLARRSGLALSAHLAEEQHG